MPVNADKPERWKSDVVLSVDTYNNWFMHFAPTTYQQARIKATEKVELALYETSNLKLLTPSVLLKNPSILPILRMATAPPIARDRLIGLAKVTPSLVKSMESDKRISSRNNKLNEELTRISDLILKLVDKDIFPWLENKRKPNESEIHRVSTIIADRLCGNNADPIIRNTQEQRQLHLIGQWLEKHGYRQIKSGEGLNFDKMEPGTYIFRLNIPISLSNNTKIKIPVDVAIMPKSAKTDTFPLLIEAKSAGDFTNTNKRRKEEAMKVAQLRNNYGDIVKFILFLCGYFDTGYLGYEAAEGIDWIWEHRIDDLTELGI